MNHQLQLPLPTADTPEADIISFAASQLETFKAEAQQASELSQIAFQRAWAVGKACVTLKDKVGEAGWEEYATKNIGEYFPIYRCMRLARMSPDGPPLKGSGQYKQLQIALGNEPPPKTTPRKVDAYRFTNLKASIGCIRRWWREGDGVTGMDQETLREIRDDLKPIMEIYENINARLTAE
jgi:hypothetical protein